LPFLIATPFLFFLGGAMVYYIVMPFAWTFFLSFQTTGTETTLPVQLEARVSEYLDLVMTLIFAFGLCFQLPVVLTLMGKVGLLSSSWLISVRKYMVIIVLIVAAFLTPPDVFSQVLLAVPMVLLYEISIILVRLVEKNTDQTAETS
jgi:sec-independent protein translocase protein TatC